jgi:hypothetical protein
MQGSLEKRWAKADQQIFFLATYFNPYVRGRCFNRSALTSATLWSIFLHVYKRIFDVTPNSVDCLRAFEDYGKGLKEFSSAGMSLDTVKAMFEKENKDIDLVFISSRIDDGTSTGCNCVTQLAIHLLTIIAKRSIGIAWAQKRFIKPKLLRWIDADHTLMLAYRGSDSNENLAISTKTATHHSIWLLPQTLVLTLTNSIFISLLPS